MIFTCWNSNYESHQHAQHCSYRAQIRVGDAVESDEWHIPVQINRQSLQLLAYFYLSVLFQHTTCLFTVNLKNDIIIPYIIKSLFREFCSHHFLGMCQLFSSQDIIFPMKIKFCLCQTVQAGVYLHARLYHDFFSISAFFWMSFHPLWSPKVGISNLNLKLRRKSLK